MSDVYIPVFDWFVFLIKTVYNKKFLTISILTALLWLWINKTMTTSHIPWLKKKTIQIFKRNESSTTKIMCLQDPAPMRLKNKLSPTSQQKIIHQLSKDMIGRLTKWMINLVDLVRNSVWSCQHSWFIRTSIRCFLFSFVLISMNKDELLDEFTRLLVNWIKRRPRITIWTKYWLPRARARKIWNSKFGTQRNQSKSWRILSIVCETKNISHQKLRSN